jgi:hypothetical protein
MSGGLHGDSVAALAAALLATAPLVHAQAGWPMTSAASNPC